MAWQGRSLVSVHDTLWGRLCSSPLYRDSEIKATLTCGVCPLVASGLLWYYINGQRGRWVAYSPTLAWKWHTLFCVHSSNSHMANLSARETGNCREAKGCWWLTTGTLHHQQEAPPMWQVIWAWKETLPQALFLSAWLGHPKCLLLSIVSQRPCRMLIHCSKFFIPSV